MSLSPKKICILVLILFAGCSLKNNKVEVVEQGRNQVSAQQNKVQIISDVEKNNGILFDGKAIKVVEAKQNNFELKPFTSKRIGACISSINEKINKKIPDSLNKENTEYYFFEPQTKEELDDEEVSSLTNKFILQLNKEQFVKLNQDSFNKLDSAIVYTGHNNLYFIKNKQQGYLVAIGHDLASSGISNAYFSYLIFPLNGNEKTKEFSSVSNDPRTISIDKSGLICYTQVNQNYYPRPADTPDSELNYYPVTVKYFTFDETSHQKLEFKDKCKDWESLSIFDE